MSQFHLMESYEYNVLSIQRTFSRRPWEYVITRLDCTLCENLSRYAVQERKCGIEI